MLSMAYCDNSTGTMAVTSAQVKMARAALDWTVRDLAKATGLHRNTINNVEVGRYAGDPATMQKLEKVLVAAGVEFIDENGGGPGVRLRKRHRPKKPK
jgi:DNA-binding XRE family transcriptional regulator